MRIAIFGAGGIGGYLGGRLAQSGEEVVLIARGEHLKAIREHGLRVDSIKGDFVATPALATANPTEAGPVDAVILGVKGWQVRDAAMAMRPMIGPDTFVVPMQNGVDAPAQLVEVLGERTVVVGLGGLVSYIVGPGHILHAGGEPYVSFGEMDNSTTDRT
ncbi:MAG TPA: 2-dehydropantoate 2-reductase, partial [Dehalococcoidia bacterium]|nr:2-dehydropantoate 2-reductase [Dehalococcoidia bacterium]